MAISYSGGWCCGALAPLNAAQKIIKTKVRKKSKK
jgi:hypothetical protein